MEEIWRDIKGFEGSYQVSNLGQVKSLNYEHTGKERVLKVTKDRYGYLTVGLHKGGKRKTCGIHRLVAQAFIPNPDGLPCVNHKDECKTNNIVSNLEWCNVKYNTNYGTCMERVAKAQRNYPTKSKTIYQYTKEGVLIYSFPSTMEAERMTGYDHSFISACCKGKCKSAYGYIWSYEPINKAYNLF